MKQAELIRMGVPPVKAKVFEIPLTDTMIKYEITSPSREAAFIAQVLHESMMLRYTQEIWGPTPAQSRYEGRADLGNTHPGDGKRFLGRGLLQTTGRSNYILLGNALNMDLVEHPEKLSEPYLAAISAGEFWKSHQLNTLADKGNMLQITKTVNGGLNGYVERLALYSLAKEVFA